MRYRGILRSCAAGGSAEADGAAARPEDVTLLHGHKSEVFTCKWNPKSDLLASGSSDATARIWPVGADGGAFVEPAVLAHIGAGKSKDVATLDWSPDGALLATGSYDGKARIWTKNGDLRHTLSRHEGPVFSLKWNNSGTALLSAGVDKSTVVWDPASGEVKQQFAFHTAPTLDVDWQSDDTFASCSTDYLIHVCQMGADKPVRTYSGHKNEVNAIQWDPSSRYLASCSDDTTAKVWTLTGDEPAADLREHKKEIYTLTWSPTATGPPTLATASFDATVKLWDVEAGRCSQTLSRHRSMVYAVSFSPDGQFVATGSLDRYLHIHSVRDGALVRTYKGGGGIFEVDWNASGDKVAACFSNNVVTVLDFRK